MTVCTQPVLRLAFKFLPPCGSRAQQAGDQTIGDQTTGDQTTGDPRVTPPR
jgi:hypothetical protein